MSKSFDATPKSKSRGATIDLAIKPINIKQAKVPKIQTIHFSFYPYHLNLLEDNVES
jgi:hypothetical protein